MDDAPESQQKQPWVFFSQWLFLCLTGDGLLIQSREGTHNRALLCSFSFDRHHTRPPYHLLERADDARFPSMGGRTRSPASTMW